jgi:hypothetical protein
MISICLANNNVIVRKTGRHLLGIPKIRANKSRPSALTDLKMSREKTIVIAKCHGWFVIFAPQLVRGNVDATLCSVTMKFAIEVANVGWLGITECRPIMEEVFLINKWLEKGTTGENTTLMEHGMPIVKVVDGDGALSICIIQLDRRVCVRTLDGGCREETSIGKGIETFKCRRWENIGIEDGNSVRKGIRGRIWQEKMGRIKCAKVWRSRVGKRAKDSGIFRRWGGKGSRSSAQTKW